MRSKVTKKRYFFLALILILSLFSFTYINCPAASGIKHNAQQTEEKTEIIDSEKLSPEVAVAKFMLGVATYVFTQER